MSTLLFGLELEGVKARLSSGDRLGSDLAWDERFSGPDGSIGFQCVLPGPCQVDFSKAGYESLTFRTTMPDDGAKELRLKKLAPILQPLHADGWDIYTADGKRYVHCQATNYLLFQRFMEGQDIEPLLYDGFDGYNVTFLMKTVPEQAGLRALTPENYPDLYRSADDFLTFMESCGKRIEGTFICDNDQLGYDVPRQNAHVNMLRDVFSGHPGHLVQLVNEWQKNGVDVMRFSKPTGVFVSRGSSLAGGACPLPAWDYSTAHLSRSGGGAYLDAQPYYMIAGYSTYAGTHGPVITNETRGASNTENSDRRTTDPGYFRRIAGAMRGYSGGTFHCDAGIHSDPLQAGLPQDECRKAFLEGMGR